MIKRSLLSICNFLQKEKIVVFFFFSYFVIGLLLFRDYGAGWDELFQNGIGWVNIVYIFGHNRYLFDATNIDKFDGPIYEMFVFGLGLLLGLFKIYGSPLISGVPNQAGMLFRHFMDFLTFFAGTIFFYFLSKKYLKSKWLALLGVLFLILSPRIFADSFYNSKDTVFLAFFIISIYFLIKFFEKKTIIRGFLSALFVAITIDIRILAVLVPAFAIYLLFVDFVLHKKVRKDFAKYILMLEVYLGTIVCFVVVMMPYLWPNPVKNFYILWKVFSHYSQNVPNLYLGHFAYATNLPWHYSLVWISITTPPLYLFLFTVGIFYVLLKLVKIKNSFKNNLYEDILYLMWFFIPLGMVIFLHSTLYNAWRQLYFVYPAFLLIALNGVVFIKRLTEKNKLFFRFLLVCLFASLLYIAKIMIDLHPYQNLYFNIFAGKNMNDVRKNFETDYWGISYRKGLEYIVKNDKRERIYVAVENDPGKTNSYLLSYQDIKRLYYVDDPKDISKADYYLTDFFNSRKDLPYKEVYSVRIRGSKIMSVYKLR